MQHLLINTHTEENCAFRSEANREALVGGFARLEKLAADQGVQVTGPWVNMASHTIFALLDATDAHAIDRLIREAGLVGNTTSNVLAVETMSTAVEAVDTARG